MSGGVGPTCGDIGLPKDEPAPLAGTAVKPASRSSFATLWQLNALTIVIVFAATGMVSLEDIAFSVFSLFYTFFMAKFAFPLHHSGDTDSDEKNKMQALLTLVGAIVGLLLPIGYIFEGILEGDQKGIVAAAPHVFLLASRVFMEAVAVARRFSVPVKAFVPVLFNVRLLFSISDWVRAEMSKAAAELKSERRLYVGRALAIANLVFWGFNLFGYLLPLYLPRAFKRYYGKVKA